MAGSEQMTSSNRIFSRTRLALTAGIAAAGLLGLATTAQAAITVQAAKTVNAGRTTSVTVIAPGSEQCTLTVPGSHSRPAFLGNGTKVAFSFRVAKTARGSYKVSVTCDTITKNTKVKVKGRKRGVRSLALTSGLIAGKTLDATDSSAPAVPPAPELDAVQARREIVECTNVRRGEAGQALVDERSELDEAAQLLAKDMAATGNLGHVDSEGRTAPDRIRAVAPEYDLFAVGENISDGHSTSASACTGWFDSPEHKDTMLSDRYAYVGVGLAYSTSGVPYWVQVFSS